ncbi:MAG: hypothetical protein O3A01_00120 [bacterium]|nr:hypothetical protein [bacterium]
MYRRISVERSDDVLFLGDVCVADATTDFPELQETDVSVSQKTSFLNRQLDNVLAAVKLGAGAVVLSNFVALIRELIRLEVKIMPHAKVALNQIVDIQRNLEASNYFVMADYLQNLGRDNVFYKDKILIALTELKKLSGVDIEIEAFSKISQKLGLLLGSGLFPLLLHFNTLHSQRQATRLADALEQLGSGNASDLQRRLNQHGQHSSAIKLSVYVVSMSLVNHILSNLKGRTDERPLSVYLGQFFTSLLSPQLKLVAFAATKLLTGWLDGETKDMREAKRELLEAFNELPNDVQAELSPLILGEKPEALPGFSWLQHIGNRHVETAPDLPMHATDTAQTLLRHDRLQVVEQGVGVLREVLTLAKYGAGIAGGVRWVMDLLPVKLALSELAATAGLLSRTDITRTLDSVDPGVFVGNPGSPGWRSARGFTFEHLDPLLKLYGKAELARGPATYIQSNETDFLAVADNLQTIGYVVVGLATATMMVEVVKETLKEHRMALMCSVSGESVCFSKMHYLYKMLQPLLYMGGVKLAYEIVRAVMVLSEQEEDQALHIMLSELAMMVAAIMPVMIREWNPLHPKFGQYDIRGLLLRKRGATKENGDDIQSCVDTLILSPRFGVRDVLEASVKRVVNALSTLWSRLPQSQRFGDLGHLSRHNRRVAPLSEISDAAPSPAHTALF